MARGFIQIRRGLEEHLVSGSIGLLEVGVYLVMHFQVDFKTGIWTGSAPRLVATAPRGANLRHTQRAIERLSEIGFIKAFHVQGQRGNYRVLLHKYEPHSGALRGKRLNALASLSWSNPVYEVCAESDAETDSESDTDVTPYLEVKQKEEVEKPKPLRVSAAREPDRFEEFSSLYPRKKNMAKARAPWQRHVKPEERDFVLARLQMFIVGEWKNIDPQFIPYPSSWLNGRRWEDELEAANGINRRTSKPNGAIAPAAGKYAQRRPDLISNVSNG